MIKKFSLMTSAFTCIDAAATDSAMAPAPTEMPAFYVAIRYLTSRQTLIGKEAGEKIRLQVEQQLRILCYQS